ncbi:PilZ domain-containing protein [Bradyrhizobium campsiandrae]|nr:PilZ domain-containing protein [Bradyrhizobium campsiandrae]
MNESIRANDSTILCRQRHCTVRNLSATGAMLDVTSPVGIPARFTLVIEAEHASKPAVVVRRQDKRIGIRFEAERASSAV